MPHRAIAKLIRPLLYVCGAFASILMLFAVYDAILNQAPSTYYFDQTVETPNGDGILHIGDEVVIKAGTIRHKLNGRCTPLAVHRVRENIGGPFDGNIHLMQYVDQQFNGNDLYRRTSWPIAPEHIIASSDWFDDPNASTQDMDMFVIGRYYCNMVDWVVPRFLENNDAPLPPEFFKRKRQLVGTDMHNPPRPLEIQGWDPHSGMEGPHTRVTLVR